jgi:hypothetical protein
MFKMKAKQIARFMSNFTQSEGCWIWRGKTFDRGYGKFSLRQKTMKAHRVAYLLFIGEIEDGKHICHKCDNPLCVNPDHLWIGTSKENTHDMIRKGRLKRNRSKHMDSFSKYPGISFRKEKKSNPWRARIMREYQTVWCKEFSSEEEAHSARCHQLRLLSS